MPTDIYHSEYIKNRNGKRETVNYTRTHDDHNDKDINTETRTEVTHYKNDGDGC